MTKKELKQLEKGVVCNKCGKSAPIDKEKSNENWTVYKTNEPCECGGKFVPKILLNK